jgi:hypothetical protein
MICRTPFARIKAAAAQFAPQIAAEFCDSQTLFESKSRFGIAKLHAFFRGQRPPLS